MKTRLFFLFLLTLILFSFNNTDKVKLYKHQDYYIIAKRNKDLPGFLLTPDSSLSLKTMFALGNYRLNDSLEINNEYYTKLHFPRAIVCLVGIEKIFTDKELIKLLEKDHFYPATAPELVYFSINYPEMVNNFSESLIYSLSENPWHNYDYIGMNNYRYIYGQAHINTVFKPGNLFLFVYKK